MELVAEKYKQTELGLIPSDWEVKKLGDIGEIRMCRRIFNNETSSKGTVPFYKIGTFGKEPDAYISQDLYNEYLKKFSFPKKGDILISAAGTIGRTIIYDGQDAYFQDSNIVWIDNENSVISNEFLYYTYQVVKYNTEGGTIQRLYNSILKSTKFVCPPLAEQTAIANALSDADALINSLEKLIAKKRNIKQATMNKLIINDKWLMVNEDYAKISLRDVCDFSSGIAHENVIDDKGQYIVVNSKFISTDGEIRKYSKSLFCPAEKEDILIVLSDVPNGKAIAKCFFVEDENTYTVNQRIGIVKSKSIHSKYLFYLLNRHKDLLAFDDGAKQTNLRNQDVLNLQLTINNSPFKQSEIAECLTDMDTELNTLETKLEKYKNVKLGMIQNLLTGKVRLV